MAYAAVSTVTPLLIDGRRHYIVHCTETEAAAASEWEVEGLPQVGTLKSYKSTHTAGTAATIQPAIGAATGWTADTQDDIAVQATAAAHIDDQTEVRYIIPGANSLFIKSTVDDGSSDNTIVTVFVIAEGHQS